ncbi:hypothetical protein HanIR_Chr09g0443401 [Helianthus annuus]|nr:hypothetical protein HanIR_Chr09g0443401 [Helianthus annuus]
MVKAPTPLMISLTQRRRCHGLPMKMVSLVFHIFTHSMKSFVNSVNLLLLAVKRGKYIGLQVHVKFQICIYTSWTLIYLKSQNLIATV